MATTPAKVGIRQRLRQIGVAFQFTRRHDKHVVWLLLLAFGVPVAIGFGVGIALQLWVLLPLALLTGVLVALIVFSRRVQRATYAEVQGKPGAAAAILDSMRGNWRVTPAIAVTPQQDVVHRVVGRPGVILVSEGSPQRLRNVLTQEKKKIGRVLPDVQIFDVAVGDGDGQVPIRKVQTHLMKMPRAITPKQINAIEQRLQALGGVRPPIPKGPMPKSGKAMKGAKQQMYRGR
ncbi:MAG TPA: DUF4191 domain-containing protein [Cryptosporangiaceae bacterium]|nr:DUF4191 domain-containing protein [Cryptosporangiaceae bacterium]